MAAVNWNVAVVKHATSGILCMVNQAVSLMTFIGAALSFTS